MFTHLHHFAKQRLFATIHPQRINRSIKRARDPLARRCRFQSRVFQINSHSNLRVQQLILCHSHHTHTHTHQAGSTQSDRAAKYIHRIHYVVKYQITPESARKLVSEARARCGTFCSSRPRAVLCYIPVVRAGDKRRGGDDAHAITHWWWRCAARAGIWWTHIVTGRALGWGRRTQNIWASLARWARGKLFNVVDQRMISSTYLCVASDLRARGARPGKHQKIYNAKVHKLIS